MSTTTTFHERGIALVSSLLLLLAITLVGVTSLRMNLSSEEMASNAYLKDQALQAAQLGLEYGEAYVRSQGTIVAANVFKNNGTFDNDYDNGNQGDNCANGICIPVQHTPNPNRTEHWVLGSATWTANAIAVPSNISAQFGLQLGPVPPRFLVEFLGHTNPIEILGSNTIKQLNSKCDTNPQDGVVTQSEGRTTYPFCLSDPRLFRITALGTSGSAANPVSAILQSTIVTP